MIKQAELSDTQFISQFEELSLDKQHFNHLGHLRVAWLYLKRFSLPVAIDKTCLGIQRFAASLGAAEKFHRTLTEALVRVIAARMESSKPIDWSAFLYQNQDLVTDAEAVLLTYYRPEQLNNPDAPLTIAQTTLASTTRDD